MAVGVGVGVGASLHGGTGRAGGTGPADRGLISAWATPPAPTAYVANINSNSVSVIDTSTNTVTTTIPVGNSPFGAGDRPGRQARLRHQLGRGQCVGDRHGHQHDHRHCHRRWRPDRCGDHPERHTRYVANGSGTVSVIDTTTNTVIATITIGAGTGPQGVAITPDGTRVYVSDFGSNHVSVISTATNTVTATVTVGSNPRGVAITPNGTRAYVTNWGSGSQQRVGGSTPPRTRSSPPSPSAPSRSAWRSPRTARTPTSPTLAPAMCR